MRLGEDLDSDPQRRRRDAVTIAILSRGEMLFANYRRRDKLFAMRKANLVLALLTILAGALVGLIVSLFRLALNHGDRLRDLLILWAHGSPVLGFVLVVATLASAAAVGSWLVRRFSPYAAGSGIPHIEAAVHGELPPAPISLLPVKFIGGWLAIAGGLALGREGPCVQMGATTAEIFHRLFRPRSTDARILLAAGAGAGLATAFNAPAAGAVFVLEELVKRFETRIAIAALGASAGAICVSRLFVGDAPEFHVAPLTYPDFNFSVWCAALGVVAGFVGVAYNRAILGALRTNDRLHRWPVELRASVIGAAVGVLAWFAPGLVGGGDPLTQRALSGSDVIRVLPFVFLARFVLGAVSYSAGVSGGLFAPMLTLGAQLGVIFGTVCRLNASAAAVVGMAAFFTAVVRAPLTGIVLITEMTGSFTQLLPMLFGCFTAMAVPTMLGNPPIYDSLRERTLRR